MAVDRPKRRRKVRTRPVDDSGQRRTNKEETLEVPPLPSGERRSTRLKTTSPGNALSVRSKPALPKIDATTAYAVPKEDEHTFSEYLRLLDAFPDLLALMEQLRPYRNGGLAQPTYDPHEAFMGVIDGAVRFCKRVQGRADAAGLDALDQLTEAARAMLETTEASRTRLDQSYAKKGMPPDLGDDAALVLWQELAATQFDYNRGAFEYAGIMPAAARKFEARILLGGIGRMLNIWNAQDGSEGGPDHSSAARALETAAALARSLIGRAGVRPSIEDKMSVYLKIGEFDPGERAREGMWQSVEIAQGRLKDNAVQQLTKLVEAAELEPSALSESEAVRAAEFLNAIGDQPALANRLRFLMSDDDR